MNIHFQNDVLLSDYTTIALGGKAKYFFSCSSIDDIKNSLSYAKKNNIRVQIISGGSNIIFPDEGFKGMVLKIDLKGISFEDDEDFVKIKASAGENWDDFVKLCIENDLAGVECLSGIPGSVGATPIQNVGAYGQEVKDSIVLVKAIERTTLEIVTFNNEECKFDYRQSRFKNTDKDKFIIMEVVFKLKKFKKGKVKYAELKNFIESNQVSKKSKYKLKIIREAVLSIRRKKSMVIDVSDPNTKSCGSFFMNPVLDENEFVLLKERAGKNFPFYKTDNFFKIPAAWLIEQVGFYKGYKKNGAAISENHSLAIINRGGTSKDVIELANEIRNEVLNKFNIKLETEPVIVTN